MILLGYELTIGLEVVKVELLPCSEENRQVKTSEIEGKK